MFRRFNRHTNHHETEQAQPLRPRRSITSRLRWSYLLSSTLPLALVGALLIALNFRTQQRNVYNEQVTLANQGSREISSYVSDIETKLLSAGRHLQPDNFRAQRDDALREMINTEFPNLREVTVYNIGTAEISHVSMERTFPPESYALRTDDPLLELALQGRGQRSDIYADEDGQYVLTIVLPLRDNARAIVGAIRAEVSATPIVQTLRMLGRSSESVAYLINDDNTVLLEGSASGWKPPPNLQEILSEDADDVEYQEGNSQILNYRNGNDVNVLGIISPVTPGTWSVIIEQPISVAFGNVWYNMIILGTMVAIVGLLALGWALLHAQRFLRPLTALREGAASIGAGRLDHRITIGREDEFGQLAQSFNHMAEQLQASLSEIEDQNERLRDGLRLARDIQMGLLPGAPPWTHDTLSVQATSVPASEVGGDFYSYLALPDGRAAISIGDISGKGVGAALFMALTSSMVESQARQATNPSDVLSSLNRLLRPRLQLNHMNAAILYAIFDLHNHTMTVANAGMIAPLLIRNGNGIVHETLPNEKQQKQQKQRKQQENANTQHASQFVEVGGLPVGSMTNALYTDVTVPLEPGDTLLFMSDGIVEAHNQDGEMFGFERIEQVVNGLSYGDNLTLLIDVMLKEVQDFIGDTEQHDDITIVAVRPTTRTNDALPGQAKTNHTASTPSHSVVH